MPLASIRSYLLEDYRAFRTFSITVYTLIPAFCLLAPCSVEDSFSCTLVCDESSLMKESWVKSCVYGTFHHNFDKQLTSRQRWTFSLTCLLDETYKNGISLSKCT